MSALYSYFRNDRWNGGHMEKNMACLLPFWEGKIFSLSPTPWQCKDSRNLVYSTGVQSIMAVHGSLVSQDHWVAFQTSYAFQKFSHFWDYVSRHFFLSLINSLNDTCDVYYITVNLERALQSRKASFLLLPTSLYIMEHHDFWTKLAQTLGHVSRSGLANHSRSENETLGSPDFGFVGLIRERNWAESNSCWLYNGY